METRRKMLTGFVAVAAALTLAATAGAETVVTKGGTKLTGDVVRVGPKEVTLDLGGKDHATVTLPLAELAPADAYSLRREAIPAKAVASHETLGDRERNAGIDRYALYEYQDAARLAGKDAAPELVKKLDSVETRFAKNRIDAAAKLEEQGHYRAAESSLSELKRLLPGTPAAAKARPRLAALRKKSEDLMRAEERASRNALEAEVVDSGIRDARDRIAEGDRFRDRGQARGDEMLVARAAFGRAIEAYERAGGILRAVRDEPGADRSATEIDRLEGEVHERVAGTVVDFGDEALDVGDVTGAERAASLALSLDPGNPGAIALRSSIADRNEDVRRGGWQWAPYAFGRFDDGRRFYAPSREEER